MRLREAKAMGDLSADELRVKERELTEELFHLRLRRAATPLPNPMKVQSTRRALARVKTLLKQRTALGGAAR